MKKQIYNAVKESARAIKRNCSPFALSCNMCVVFIRTITVKPRICRCRRRRAYYMCGCAVFLHQGSPQI